MYVGDGILKMGATFAVVPNLTAKYAKAAKSYDILRGLRDPKSLSLRDDIFVARVDNHRRTGLPVDLIGVPSDDDTAAGSQ